MGIWNSFTSAVARWLSPSQAAAGQPPRLKWLGADQTPFGVKVLDVAPLARVARSRPEDPAAAEAHRAALEAATAPVIPLEGPPPAPTTTCALRYETDAAGIEDGALFRPRVLEEKWALYLSGPHIVGVRAWTGAEAFRLTVVRASGHLTVTHIHGDPGDGGTDPEHRARVVDFLLRAHGLGEILPAPVPQGLHGASPEDIARALFQRYGRRALAATHADLRLPRPDRPLRTDTATWLAAATGDAAALRLLLQNTPATKDHSNQPGVFQGSRPLHAAASMGATECVRILLEHGVPVDVLDDSGATPLLAAAQQHGPDVSGAIALLMAHGADASHRLPDGSTAVHLATRAGRTGVVRALLEAGADATATDYRGFSALHSAAELGIVPLVRILMDHGADPTLPASPPDGAEPVTPTDLARTRGHTAALEQLAPPP